MQIEETLNVGLKRSYRVVLPAADIDARVTAKLGEIARDIQLPGFRPGKVPAALIRQRYGQSIRGEVLEEAVNESSAKVLEERGLRPAMRPKIEVETAEEGADLAYGIEVEVLPEFTVMDLASIELERLVLEVDDAQVDEAMAKLAEGSAKGEPVAETRPAVSGDTLVIDFKGTVDGEAREGMSGEDMPVDIGSGQLIPGFEDQLIGASPGDHVTVNVTFPADYGEASLQSKDAVFEIDVKELQTKVIPVIDDAFAGDMGFDSLDGLKDAVRRRIRQDYTQAARQRLKRDLLDKLEEGHEFELPPTMVDMEFNGIWQQVQQDREKGEGDPDDAGKSDEELQAEYRKIAERRVRVGLVLAEIGRANDLRVSEEEMQRAVIQQAQQYPSQAQQIVKFYRETPGAMEQLQAPLFEEKVVDYLLEMADVTDRTVDRDTFLAEVGEGHDHDHDHDHDHGDGPEAPASPQT